MYMICCSYDTLLSSTNLGVAVIRSGGIYSGGETSDSSFDYVRNIVLRLNPDGSIRYEVEVGKMFCPEPIPIQTSRIQEVYNPSPYVVSDNRFYCFAADSTIQLTDGREIRMDKLQLKGFVKCPEKHFSEINTFPITGWLHRMEGMEAECFVSYSLKKERLVFRISTISGKEIKLTGKHLIYRTSCNSTEEPILTTADSLKVGECVMETKENYLHPVQISRISNIIQKGIFAPLTDNGDIIVNEIAVSCYSETSENLLIQSIKDTFVSCGETSAVCDVSRMGASLLLDMVNIVLPFKF